LSEAVLSLGDIEGRGWTVDLGRQHFSLGDERLVGANRDFGQRSPGWDGVRAEFRLRSAGFTLLGGEREGGRLTGVVASLLQGTALIEPYFLQLRDTRAVGLRLAGTAQGATYNVEVTEEGAGVWAGHWEVSRQARSITAGVEFNYATPGFDEISPATMNKYGTEDPFPWSDSRNVAVNVDRTVWRNVQLGGSYRSYWTSAGTYLSQHVAAGVAYQARRWRLDAGCGRLVAERTHDIPRWTPYIALSYRM
jgi:hypothetical protein